MEDEHTCTLAVGAFRGFDAKSFTNHGLANAYPDAKGLGTGAEAISGWLSENEYGPHFEVERGDADRSNGGPRP